MFPKPTQIPEIVVNDAETTVVEFILRDEQLAAELPISIPLNAPLSFEIHADQEPTVSQLTEIVEKLDYTATGITGASDVLERNFREYLFAGVHDADFARRVGRPIGLASVFDGVVLGWLEHWECLLRAAHAGAAPLVGGSGFERTPEEESIRRSAAEIARQVYKLLAKDLTLTVGASPAASVPAHTVDQRTACKIMKASDSTLRRGGYFHNVAGAAHDPTKLNGVLVGREWRFEVSEVHRFADFYWGRKKAPTEGAGPPIRGRDV